MATDSENYKIKFFAKGKGKASWLMDNKLWNHHCEEYDRKLIRVSFIDYLAEKPCNFSRSSKCGFIIYSEQYSNSSREGVKKKQTMKINKGRWE